jgi:twitching motility protein PilT
MKLAQPHRWGLSPRTICSEYPPVPGVPLNSFIDIDATVLSAQEKMQQYTILPVSADESTVTLAMANPMDQEAIKEIGFTLGRKVTPVVSPVFMLEAAINSILNNPGRPLVGPSIAEMVDLGKGEKLPGLHMLLQYMLKIGADDLLLTAGTPPSLKISNRLKRLSVPALTPTDCEKYARELLPFNEWEKFLQKQDHGLSVSVPGIGRFRTTIYRQRDAIAIAIRPIFDKFDSGEFHLPA